MVHTREVACGKYRWYVRIARFGTYLSRRRYRQISIEEGHRAGQGVLQACPHYFFRIAVSSRTDKGVDREGFKEEFEEN
jgi:hypothetical protein